MIIINGRNVWPQDLESLAEAEPEVRTGDASAFAVRDAVDGERAVLVVQCRNVERAGADRLADRIRAHVLKEWGIVCAVDLVPRNTLPRTTSGKLSRTRARQDFLRRRAAADGDTQNQHGPGNASRKHAVG